ncbi:MAG TPA: hypothetical protein VGK59_18545 [Ohtaekwangia sp.]
MPWVNKEAEKAYKAAYYQKHKNSDSLKESRRKSVKKWRSKNKLKVNKYARDTRDPMKSKAQWEKHKDKHNSIGRKETEELSEKYIIKQLKKEGFTIEDIRQYPELIDTKKQIIKTKRLWNKSRTSKNSVTASAKTIRK